MIVKRGNGDFSQIYRPCRISEVVGNDRIKKIIEEAFKQNKIPHTFLFHGISGTGKTTIARIIELGLNCEEGPTSEPCCECKSCRSILKRNGHAPVREINAVKIVIDEIKKLLEEMADYGFGLYGQSKRDLLLVDECHGLRKDQASLFLTYVEDAIESMYFIFCTTNPKDFLDTLKNRCAIQTEFKEVPEKEILKLLSQICEREYLIPNQKVFARILEESHGMPRNAVNKLQEAYLAGELKKKEILFLEGTNNIVVVAPHEPTINDENVNIIAEQLHKDLGCYAVINEKYKRDDVNLNNISELKKKGVEDEFLVPLRRFKDEIKRKGAPPLMVYVHGIATENIRTLGGLKSKILIGYGQGEDGNKNRPSWPTLAYYDIELLEDSLTSAGLHAVEAPIASIYCARDENNLNQLFNLPVHTGYYDPIVRSVQLEIRMADLRGDEREAVKTGRLLAAALKPFVDVKAPTAVKTSVASASTSEPNSKPDPELVGRSLAFLKNAFKKGIYAAKLEAGEFIIHQVLKYDYELARNLKKAKKSNRTLKDLMGQLKGEDGNTPSKTWVYDAVKLAVDEKDFCGFHSYGMLGLSHKVRLTSISDPETKKQLIQKAVDKKWTVAGLRSEIAKEREKAQKEKTLLMSKTGSGYGFREWAGKTLSICTGCENDCIYCWAKEGAYRRKQVLPGKWPQSIVRQKDVDQERRFYKTLVAFPSTHDILPTNIDAYLIVLGKLLRAGNDVLIVSKPRPDCIKRICSPLPLKSLHRCVEP